MVTFERYVDKLQLLEKEKLILIAASHLDGIQCKFTLFEDGHSLALRSTPGDTQSRIGHLEKSITEIMEEIQSEKCILPLSDVDV